MNIGNDCNNKPVAIVGLSGIFPGASKIQEFWSNILNGKDFITDVPPNYWLIDDYYDPDPFKKGKTYAKRGGFLPRIDFDPTEFWLPPNSLKSIDTVQLLSLVMAKKVLNDCRSVQSGKVDRKKISVILGGAAATEMMLQMMGHLQFPNWRKSMRESRIPEAKIEEVFEKVSRTYLDWTENSFPGALGNITAGRISNRLDLGGSNCVVDAACASSLAAVSMAVKELQTGHSDMVITGGADAHNDIFMFMCFSKTPALSPTGDCRPFSDNADGTMLGEGIGMIALRRLEDAERDRDRIYAVIRGVGSSSDGMAKSIYAPLPDGQALAVRRAYDDAGFDPSEIELIEAHGTATRANDEAEFNGLCRVFDREDNTDRQWCALGSVKSQIGHTKAAAGAASLIKAALSLHHRILPPTIKIERSNPRLDFHNSPFYPNTSTRPWIHDTGSTRKAGVSAFGFGGTNFHVALEEYHSRDKKHERFTSSPVALILLSSDSREEMVSAFTDLENRTKSISVHDLARTTQEGFNGEAGYRAALIVRDAEDCLDLTDRMRDHMKASPESGFSIASRIYYSTGPVSRSKKAFLFPGQGSQYLNMTSELVMEFEEVRKVWDSIAGLRINETSRLHNVVFPLPVFSDEELKKQSEILTRTQWAQPALGIASVSVLRLLETIGLKPDCTAGHSYGEIPALYAAGVLSCIEDLVSVSSRRGNLMSGAASAAGPGAMTAVRAQLAEAESMLEENNLSLTIANINSPGQIVLSGSLDEIEKAEDLLSRTSMRFIRLPVATAFHSRHVSRAAAEFRQFLQDIEFSAPAVPVYANSTGRIYPDDPREIPRILAMQLSSPVLFRNQVDAMYADGVRVFIEVGPGAVLTGLVKECLEGRDFKAVSMDNRNQNSLVSFWNALGMLASSGISIDFKRLWDNFAAETDIRQRDLSSVSIRIDGSNYGKPYPPEQGPSALPEPVTEYNPAEYAFDNPAAVLKASAEKQTDSPVSQENIAPPGHSVRTGDSEWLNALQALQDNMQSAHRSFQKTLTESHMEFLRTSEAILDKLVSASGIRQEKRPVHKDAVSPARDSGIIPSPPDLLQEAAASVKDNPEITGNVPAMDEESFKQVLLEILSEKTGYPEDVLDFDTDMESGFGIDSIKKVEILSDFQDRFPGIELTDVQALYTLGTLGEVADYVKAAFSSSPDTKKTDESVFNPRAADREIKRKTVKAVPSRENNTMLDGLENLEFLNIIEDNRGVAQILCEKLNATGILSRVVSELTEEGDGVLFLEGINVFSGSDKIDEALELNRSAFKAAQRCALRMLEQGGVFITVQDTGGDFGLSGESGERSWSAGLGALAKTLAREWPEASVKCIDIKCGDQSPDRIAQAISDELMNGGREIEVGLGQDGERISIATLTEDLTYSFRPLPEGSVIIASGGGRGITAACLLALADRSALKLAVLGRTVLEDEPEYAAVCKTDAEIRKALIDEDRRNNRESVPSWVSQKVRNILSNREIKAAIRCLKEKGSEVRYYSADICDTDKLESIVREIHEQWGEIKILIHGAGIISDSYIHEKTMEQFENVFKTKVYGFRNLLSATQDDPLTHICCFSSIVARGGNIRQADYAMANEVLNKVCAHESRRRGSGCMVKAINWGPWDAGMVTPQHKLYFESKGYVLIPLPEGTGLFVKEMEDSGGSGPVEIILSGELGESAEGV